MTPIDDEYLGKVAVITGAGAGLGEAFARALSAHGAHLAILDIDERAGQRVAGELSSAGVSAAAFGCDIGQNDSIRDTVAAIRERFHCIDILINNAGLHSSQYNVGFETLGEEETRRLFAVNLLGLVEMTVQSRPLMAGRGASVINMASSAGYTCTSAYGVSKLAVRGATICLATEFAKDDIRVNAIAPGLIGTRTNVEQLPRSLFDSYENELQLVRRPGRVDDVVEMMLFLCSRRSAFVNGETLNVTGGYPLAI